MMKTVNRLLLALLALVGLVGMSGCEDWESGDSFNTSRGAGAFINFSGVYRPRSGAYLVGTNITQIVLTQVGNSVEVRDSNGSVYTGSVGSPGIMADADPVTGLYPAGATMLQGQIAFSGKDVVSGQTVNFVGILHAVAVNDVSSVDETTTTGVDASSDDQLDIIQPIPNGTYTINTTSNTTYTVQNTTTHNYSVTDANTQYVLEGQWMVGSAGYSVSGIAPALDGTFSTVSQQTTTATP